MTHERDRLARRSSLNCHKCWLTEQGARLPSPNVARHSGAGSLPVGTRHDEVRKTILLRWGFPP
jgi:hypothetical protein